MDRIFSLYQYRYPDTWVEEAEQSMGTFTMPKGSMQGADSALSPFHMNAKGDMWTSNTIRNWTVFGYTYPEMMDSPNNASFTASLNKLYKPVTQGIGNYTNATLPGLPDKNSTTTQATDWRCKINMPSNIKVSYSVRVFLGEPDADPKNWPTDPNYVGNLATLSSARMDSNLIVTGNIGLSEKLAAKYQAGELKSLAKDDVAAYLKEKFTWRIQAVDFSEIPRTSPPAGLNVTVFSVPVEIPESDEEVPVYNGDREFKPEIEGIVPVYNGNGPSGTNNTTPQSGVRGNYNAGTGQFEWKNVTKPDAGASAGAQVSASVGVSLSVQASTIVPPPSSKVVVSPIASSVVVSSAQAPGTTPAPEYSPNGPQTKYVTEIVWITK